METKQNPKQVYGNAARWRLLVLAALVLFLAACSGGIQKDVPDLEPTSHSELSTWHNRLLTTINNPNHRTSTAWMDPMRQAGTGDLYTYGRDLNNAMTSYIADYRVTRSRTVMGQINRVMDRVSTKLKDYNGDGYRNFRYLRGNADSSSRPFYGGDYHEMDEIMTHSMIAAAAYALKQGGYSSDASFWTNYLKNDFEKKWRKRKGLSSSKFPFLRKNLIHVYAQFIRYHYYMYKLTGSSAYYREATRMANVVQKHMISVGSPGGTAYIWDHWITDNSSRRKIGCQRMTYVKYTTQAFQDLAEQNFSVFNSDTFMRKVANSVSWFLLKNSSGTSLARDICGGVSRGGLHSRSGSDGTRHMFAQYPYISVASWDTSGRLATAARRAYDATVRRTNTTSVSYNIPANMVYLLGN